MLDENIIKSDKFFKVRTFTIRTTPNMKWRDDEEEEQKEEEEEEREKQKKKVIVGNQRVKCECWK